MAETKTSSSFKLDEGKLMLKFAQVAGVMTFIILLYLPFILFCWGDYVQTPLWILTVLMELVYIATPVIKKYKEERKGEHIQFSYLRMGIAGIMGTPASMAAGVIEFVFGE
jgi:hypothetical protein